MGNAPQPDLFDAARALRERDVGIRRVIDGNPEFKQCAAAYIDRLPYDWWGSGEDIRRGYLNTSEPKPSHPNAWGGVIMGAVRRGVLINTGKRKHMEAEKSHGRTTDIYRKAR